MGWMDEPSHRWLPWSKNLSHPTNGMDRKTKPPTNSLVKKYNSSYLWGGRINKASDECLDQNLSHPTYRDGQSNQVTDECLGKKI